MNIVDDTDGPLDPRIQIELEKLNNATDDINKLEVELEEANTALKSLIEESTNRFKELITKLGTGCIEKARCYFEALEVQQQARVQCQQLVQQYQRENAIHSAAKETVTLAEARYLSHQHEWNFDQAWQDMLNHATIKVMEAEHSKTECAREHQKWTALFHDAEKKVQQLEEKYRKSIVKAKPYFELRSLYDQKIPVQKERVDCLKKAVKEAKNSYSLSLRTLEKISNQIHEKRRDYDMLTKGPREPGVGAELNTPEEIINYQDQFNKASISRVNSVASSETDMEDRAQDFEDIMNLRQRVDQLNGRSADGSESSNPNQWEIELQVSIEKINKSPPSDAACSNQQHSSNLDTHKTSEYKPVVKDNELYHGWSLTQSPINSIINRSKLAFKNSISKSLTSSPVNMGSFSFGKSKILESQVENNESQIENNSKSHEGGIFPKELIVGSNEHINAQNLRVEYESQKNCDTHQTKQVACSSNASPVNGAISKNLIHAVSKEDLTSQTKLSSNNKIVLDDTSSISKTKELPLLSFFQKSVSQKPTIDKSCSMINLNEKQNLKTLLGNSDLGNIQAVSVERLINARHKLIGDY